MLVADLRADTEMRANPEACHHQVPGDPVQALKRDMNVPLVRESAALSILTFLHDFFFFNYVRIIKYT